MGLKEIPKTYVYSCDFCPNEITLNELKTYPLGWMHIRVSYQEEWHDPSYTRLACSSCMRHIKIFVDKKGK